VEGSPDLSEDHRYRLVEYYQLEYLRALKRHAAIDDELTGAEASTRGGDATDEDGGPVSAGVELKRILHRVGREDALSEAMPVLRKMEDTVRDLPAWAGDPRDDAPPPDDETSEARADRLAREQARIQDFIQASKEPAPVSASTLARALTIGSLRD
jgi:hypothetical protein